MGDVQDLLSRVWNDLAARPAGPLQFRFLVQPLVAILLAVRDGIMDARAGRSPYTWSILADRELRGVRLREGLAATAKIFAVALLLDAFYQLTVLRAFYPVEALIVAIFLAFIPYVLARGPAVRIARRLVHPTPGPGETQGAPRS